MLRLAGSKRRLPPLTLMAWLRFDAIRRAFAAVAPATVLELGCGEGALATWLAARAVYTGVEPDPDARATARARLAGVSGATVCASLDETAGLRVDLAGAFEVLEHVEDDVAMMAALRGRLVPGGALLLSVPAHPDRYGASDELVGHHRRYARSELAARLARAGFAVTWIESYGAGAGNLLDRVQDALAARTLAAEVRDDAAGGVDAGAVGTAGSGRYLQPSSHVSALVRAGAAAPARLVQRPFRTTDVGVGFVALARAVT
jgi:SAM-dependent methyltransferase